MEIKREAAAGSLESSDILVTVMPGGDGIQIHLESSVDKYYGASIQATMRQVLEELGVERATVEAVDPRRAGLHHSRRLTTAVRRAGREVESK